MTTDRPGRRVIPTKEQQFEIYDLDGPSQPEIEFMPLSYTRATGQGTYLMRMEPGAQTIAHTHRFWEDFMVLEGHLIDDDGTVFGPGDHITYDPGTHHNSRTEDGCLLIVFERRDVPA